MEDIYHNIIRGYIRHGFAPIPVKFRSKEPTLKGWNKLRISEIQVEEYFDEIPTNIGILTGKPSAGLVDVDIDHPDALRFVRYFLPQTNCVFGRASKPKSHLLYRVPDPRTVKTYSAKSMIIELRGDNHCTIFPGSMHQSGETIEFENPNDYNPAESTWAELSQGTTKVAIATVLYSHWSEHSHERHALALAVAAFLARRGWKQEDVTALVEAIAKEAHDQELEDRLRCVDNTFAAYAKGKPVSGDGELVELMGPEIAQRIENWARGKVSKKKEKQETHSHNSSAQGNGSIDITTDAAAADAFSTTFKDRLVYSNGQWFYREVQVLEPIPVEYVQGLAKNFFQAQVGKIANGPLAFSPLKSLLSRTRINAAVELSEQCLFILIGTGANGKSTLLKVLQHIFGRYAGTIPMTTLMEQRFGSQQTNDLAYLVGKRLVVGSEGERGQKLAEGKIKLMTGGDRIVCRCMYKDYFEFDPQFKLWLATNDLPTISGMDDAIWRRIYVIEFPVSFAPEQQDKTLGDRLIQEASGIFQLGISRLL